MTVFWQDAVQPDLKKNAKWKAFAAAVEKTGLCVQFPRKTTGDIVKLLVSGAARRGSALTPDNAKLLVERCGDDLNLLLNEIDKLSALAGGGEITREHIETAATKNLEASVFDLSKALLQNNYERSYTILNTLFYQKEEPVAILAVLSGAYADLYRAKAAAQAGCRPSRWQRILGIAAGNGGCATQPGTVPGYRCPCCGRAWRYWRRRTDS